MSLKLHFVVPFAVMNLPGLPQWCSLVKPPLGSRSRHCEPLLKTSATCTFATLPSSVAMPVARRFEAFLARSAFLLMYAAGGRLRFGGVTGGGGSSGGGWTGGC